MSRDPLQQVSARAGSRVDAGRPGTAVVRPGGSGLRPARSFAAALALAIVVSGTALHALPARATAFEWSRVQGHASFGYGRLMIGHSPSGSIGVTVGFEHPVRPGLDAGLDLGIYLYGNRSVDRGSLNATVDYASQDVILFTHWAVPLTPLTRVSVGAGFTHARAELSASAGGGQFLDLAVDRAAPTLAVDLSMLKRRPAPVRVAIVAGFRDAFLPGEDWSQFSLRLGFHY